MPVEIAIQLPDDAAAKLRQQGSDLSRVGLEKLICSLYRDGQLSQAEAMRDLAIANRLTFEELLTHHRLHRDWSTEEMDAEFAALDRLHGRS